MARRGTMAWYVRNGNNGERMVNAAALVTDLVTEETIIRDGMEYSMDLLSDPEGFTFLINPER